MKTIFNRILLTGVFVLGANAFAASASGDEFENWYHKKFGRPAPQQEARVATERAATAFRAEEPAQPLVMDWNEVYFRAKWGRATPRAEIHLKELRENTAFREESPNPHPARVNLIEEYMRGKWGRVPETR